MPVSEGAGCVSPCRTHVRQCGGRIRGPGFSACGHRGSPPSGASITGTDTDRFVLPALSTSCTARPDLSGRTVSPLQSRLHIAVLGLRVSRGGIAPTAPPERLSHAVSYRRIWNTG
ncbi:hypothetical protein FM105_00750 [Brevibacterium yomogidense]|uniref:Uncharacterized protein n=1 Tax=Brevibacterium yomogidense TaxID=946573 RepID=A0A1X6WTY6_9MICO|nr:hypothetical protein FM105_00750 [Brevibacterium yomogidense]